MRTLSLLLPLLAAAAAAASPAVDVEAAFANAHADAVAGRLERAEAGLEAVLSADASHSPALHTLGALRLLLHADVDGAVALRARARAADPALMPPMALLHQQRAPLAGLGDVWFVAAATLRALLDAPGPVAPDADRHVSLATMLEDSGATDAAAVHFAAAAALRPADPSLAVRAALTVPVIYADAAAAAEGRAALVANLEALERRAGLSLASLNGVSMPGTYYYIYAGENDAPVMQAVAAMYARVYVERGRCCCYYYC